MIIRTLSINLRYGQLIFFWYTSSFTFLFQDECGGLEFENPAQKGDFLAANPKAGSLVLNIGDMVQRISNGWRYWHSFFETPVVDGSKTVIHQPRIG